MFVFKIRMVLDLYQKQCQYCQGRSYSAYNNPSWQCPYCGKNIGDDVEKEEPEQEINGKKQNADQQRSAIGRKNIISI